MDVYTTTASVNGTSSLFTNLFDKMRKMLNVSPTVMFIIFIGILLLSAIVILILIFLIRRCLLGDDGSKKRRRDENDGKNIFGDDSEKYDSEFGYIDLSISYDKKRKRLIIRDIQACNLKVSSDEPPDCYARVYLKNAKGKKINIKKTITKVDNYMPIFEEMFAFPIERVDDAVIYFQIVDNNPHGNDIILGEGRLEMKKFQADEYVGPILQTYVILSQPTEKDGYGDICVIISNRLNRQKIVILEAKDLVFKYQKNKMIGVYTYPSVYVKITVKSRHYKRQFTTKTVHNTENPYFHEVFELSIKVLDLPKTCIKVEVFETLPGRIAKRIGQVYIGNPEVNKEIKTIGKLHWDLVCKDLNSPKAMWHSLIH